MCFYVSHHFPNELIAQEDITVYKVLVRKKRFKLSYEIPWWNLWERYRRMKEHKNPKTLFSYVQDFEYTVGTIHKLDKPLKKRKDDASYDGSIDIGFHSWQDMVPGVPYLSTLHTYTVLCSCIIPKGSTYYYNEFDRQYVSNAICVVRVLTKEEIYDG